MITYNVDKAFFAHKNDAEAHRKTLGLPKEALIKLSIDDRYELTAMLNALMGLRPETAPAGADLEPVPEDMPKGLVIEVPDFVPKFLAEAEAKRQGAKIKWVSASSFDSTPEP